MKPTQEFKEQKELLELKRQLETERHQHKIQELMLERKNDEIRHEQTKEAIRIKSAEIKRTQMRK